jgi:hypothetical protein
VTTLQRTPGIAAVQLLPMAPGASVGILQIMPATAPQDVATDRLIDHLHPDDVRVGDLAHEAGGSDRAISQGTQPADTGTPRCPGTAQLARFGPGFSPRTVSTTIVR